jgi:sulfite exporter TauE/SafE
MELWAAWILGLVGSLHCAGMCGPLALALPHSKRGPAGFALERLAYNLGRILTYCVIGLIVGAIGKTWLLAGIQRWLSLSLGLLVLAGFFASCHRARWLTTLPITRLVDGLKKTMAEVLRRRSGSALLILGMLNGLLPCGLVYVACAGAAATGGVLTGALYMLAFGAGTVPMMLAVSLSGKLIPFSLRLKLLRTVPIAVILLGTLLILRGMELGIPYVSPILAGDTHACCTK